MEFAHAEDAAEAFKQLPAVQEVDSLGWEEKLVPLKAGMSELYQDYIFCADPVCQYLYHLQHLHRCNARPPWLVAALLCQPVA